MQNQSRLDTFASCLDHSGMPGRKILIIDDDDEIRGLLSSCLEKEGYSPIEAADGEKALSILRQKSGSVEPELVILDLMLGVPDGFDILKIIRVEKPEIAVIILSAKNDDYDKVMGFGLGADDYVTKPFSIMELMARIAVRLRRTSSKKQNNICHGALKLDLEGCLLYKDEKKISLSAHEFFLMKLFMENPGRVFTKAQLYNLVWGGDAFEDNTIMVQISRLRDKIEKDSANPEYLLTIRGLGYKFLKDIK